MTYITYIQLKALPRVPLRVCNPLNFNYLQFAYIAYKSPLLPLFKLCKRMFDIIYKCML